jgi:hypothetical protein
MELEKRREHWADLKSSIGSGVHFAGSPFSYGQTLSPLGRELEEYVYFRFFDKGEKCLFIYLNRREDDSGIMFLISRADGVHVHITDSTGKHSIGASGTCGRFVRCNLHNMNRIPQGRLHQTNPPHR